MLSEIMNDNDFKGLSLSLILTLPFSYSHIIQFYFPQNISE